jgi:hypothetical protein
MLRKQAEGGGDTRAASSISLSSWAGPVTMWSDAGEGGAGGQGLGLAARGFGRLGGV